MFISSLLTLLSGLINQSGLFMQVLPQYGRLVLDLAVSFALLQVLDFLIISKACGNIIFHLSLKFIQLLDLIIRDIRDIFLKL